MAMGLWISPTRGAAAHSTPPSTTPRPRAAPVAAAAPARRPLVAGARRRPAAVAAAPEGATDDNHQRQGGKKTTATKSPGALRQAGQEGPGRQAGRHAEKQKIEQPTLRNPNGSPANTNPGLTVAHLRPRPDRRPQLRHRLLRDPAVPPADLPVLRHRVRDSLAGARRHQQDRDRFRHQPERLHCRRRGLDAVHPLDLGGLRGRRQQRRAKDPYNPVDAICAAARYLRAAGGDKNIRQAIFSYNHADWYVDEVLLYANQYGKLPDALVGSLTGLTEGAHFPVAADARYADDINDAAALARSTTQRRASGNAADVISSDAARRSINIYSSLNAPVVAVNDGVIKKIGDNPKLGRYIVLQDAYGNTYTYSQLGSIEKTHPVPRSQNLSAKDFKLETPNKDSAPNTPATAGDNSAKGAAKAKSASAPRATVQFRERPPAALRPAAALRQRGQPGHRRPDRAAARPQRARLRDLQVGLLEQPAVRLQHDAAEAAQGRLQGNRRHRDRAHRPDRRSSRRTSTSQSGPPAAALRRSTRSRSSTAGSCSRPPRSTAPPTRIPSPTTPPSDRSC